MLGNEQMMEKIVGMLIAKLSEEHDQLSRQWISPQAVDTRHFVLEEVLPEALASEIASSFPLDASGFHQLSSFRERKHTMAKLSKANPLLRAVSQAFQDPRVVAIISKITAFDGLVGDQSFYAGGLSMMFPGDFLNPHIDNSHDGSRKLYRRLNLLYYLNQDWSLEEGGNFELWDRRVLERKTILSGFNRLVVMETDRNSWHSVSQVQGTRSRKCVSNYYFSSESPTKQPYFQVTSFTGRPGEFWNRAVGPLDNALRFLVLKVMRGWVPGRSRADLENGKSRVS